MPLGRHRDARNEKDPERAVRNCLEGGVSDLAEINRHIEALSKRIGTISELSAAYAARARIIERDSALSKAAPDLLALAHQYADECGDCGGTRVCPDDEPCTACADVWEVIDKAEGRT